MRADDRGARGQKRAARLLANLSEARKRARTAMYDKQDYDGSELDEDE